MGVDKIQPNASLTVSVGFLAILADGRTLVTFQMSLSARQTSCAYSFGLGGRCSASGIDGGVFGHRAISNGVRAGRGLFRICLLDCRWLRHLCIPALVCIGMWWRQ